MKSILLYCPRCREACVSGETDFWTQLGTDGNSVGCEVPEPSAEARFWIRHRGHALEHLLREALRGPFQRPPEGTGGRFEYFEASNGRRKVVLARRENGAAAGGRLSVVSPVPLAGSKKPPVFPIAHL